MVDNSTSVAIKYTARDYAAALADLTAFIQATRPQDQTDFFQSSLGQALIELVAYTTDVLSYGQDVMAQELFLATARRYESVLRFCRSVGYVPRSAVGAKVVVRALDIPASVAATGAVVEAGAFVTGINGLNYEVTEQVIIPPGSVSYLFALVEGQTFTEVFANTRAARQEFTVSRGIVEDASWKVFVGDATNLNNIWTQVSNVSLETSPSLTYEVAFDGDGKVTFIFGDGNAGKIPDASVTAIFRTCHGDDGNSSVSTIKGSLKGTLIGGSTAVSLDVTNIDQSATGGRNRESVAELRVSVPAFIRTLDKLITLKDYQESMTRIPDVALGYADVPLASYSGNIVRCYAWARENVDFTATSSSNGLSSTVSYSQYTQIAVSRIQAIQNFISPRSMVTVHNIIQRPTVALVDLDFGVITYNRLYKITDVHRSIVEAVVALFQESSGFIIYVSELYERILKVPGVKFFQIQRIVFVHLNPLNSTITLTDDMRQNQDAGGLVGGPYAPIIDISTPAAHRRAFYDASYLYNGEIRYDGDVDASSVQALNLRSLSFSLQS